MKKLKNQLKKADRLNAKFAIIIGEEELKEQVLLVRNLRESKQEKISFQEFLKKLRSI